MSYNLHLPMSCLGLRVITHFFSFSHPFPGCRPFFTKSSLPLDVLDEVQLKRVREKIAREKSYVLYFIETVQYLYVSKDKGVSGNS